MLQYPAVTAAVHVTPAPCRFSSWRGAAVLASLDATVRVCITRAQYEETGVAVAYRSMADVAEVMAHRGGREGCCRF